VQSPHQAGELDQHLTGGSPVGQWLPRHVTGHERQHLAANAVVAHRHRRRREALLVQMSQVGLDGRCERTPRPAHCVSDLHDTHRHAVAKQRDLHAVLRLVVDVHTHHVSMANKARAMECCW